jgi:hypothetical protein
VLLESEQGERTIFVAEHHTHEGMIAFRDGRSQKDRNPLIDVVWHLSFFDH